MLESTNEMVWLVVVGGIWMLLLWGFVTSIVGGSFSGIPRRQVALARSGTSLEIASDRLARGEITLEQFEEVLAEYERH